MTKPYSLTPSAAVRRAVTAARDLWIARDRARVASEDLSAKIQLDKLARAAVPTDERHRLDVELSTALSEYSSGVRPT